MEYFKQIQSHLQQHNLPSIIQLWEEYCLSDEIDLEELIAILSLLKPTPYSDAFGRYVDQIFPLWEKCNENEHKHEAFLLITDIASTNSKDLAQKIISYLEKRFPNEKEFGLKLKMVGLKDQDDFKGAARNFELLNHLKKGNYVFHDAGWGAGEIMDVSFIREEVSLEFENVVGRKDLSFKNAFKTLHPIAKDHFLALRFGHPDELERMAKEDSSAVVKKLLKDLGPKTASEIKDELCDVIILEDEWSKWWSNARSKLKKDTMVESPSSLKEPFALRKQEMSHEDRLIQALNLKESVPEIIDHCYEAVRDFAQSLKNKEFKEKIKNRLKECLAEPTLTKEQLFEVLFILSDLGQEQETRKLEEEIEKIEEVSALLDRLTILAYKKRLLQILQKVKTDWISTYLDLFLTIDQNPIREFIFQELMKHGKTIEIEAKIEEMLAEPHKSANAFLWYFQKIMEKGKIPYSTPDGKNRFLESLFALLYVLEQYQTERENVKKCLAILTNGRYAIVREIFQQAPKSVVQEIILLASKCQSITDHDRKILQSLAEVVHPSLSKLSQKSQDAEEEDEIIWSTEEGYFKLKDKIHHIATVETVDNAREIEVARSHGDLRENSEYKFALERRDRLQSEIKMLSTMLGKMRILTQDDVDVSRVSVGTVITFKNKTGASQVFSLLGPMDSDIDKNILSFQSKLAQTMKGKKVGDKVHIQGEDWVVEKIDSFFRK
jgi:transcription elongation factor GreA-like protein/transcription elongation GreA/GreB family factor